MPFDQLRGFLIPCRGDGHYPKATLIPVMGEAPTKIIKPLVVGLTETTFDGERTDRLDEAEAGNIVAGTWFLK
jgi:hypothetical protein